MAYGVKIKNQNGEIQIDGTYRNMSLKENGNSISVSNNNDPNTYFTIINITATPLIPMILFQPNTDYFATISSYVKTGSNFSSFNAITQYNQTTTINWKLYTETPDLSTEKYGLRIRNPSNNLVFDSGKEYTKILDIQTVAPVPTSGYVDISHPSIENPFYLLSPIGIWFRYTASTKLHYYYKVGLKKLSSTSVRVGWFNFLLQVFDWGSSNESEGFSPTAKLVIFGAD